LVIDFMILNPREGTFFGFFPRVRIQSFEGVDEIDALSCDDIVDVVYIVRFIDLILFFIPFGWMNLLPKGLDQDKLITN